LRTVLQRGYLASPKFYWMVDEGDAWRLDAMVEVLEQVYREGDGGGDVVGQTSPAADALLERLRVVSAVNLELETAR
jgi:hypothetical protein